MLTIFPKSFVQFLSGNKIGICANSSFKNPLLNWFALRISKSNITSLFFVILCMHSNTLRCFFASFNSLLSSFFLFFLTSFTLWFNSSICFLQASIVDSSIVSFPVILMTYCDRSSISFSIKFVISLSSPYLLYNSLLYSASDFQIGCLRFCLLKYSFVVSSEHTFFIK